MKGQSQKRRMKFPEADEGKSKQNLEGSTICVIYLTSGKEQTVNN